MLLALVIPAPARAGDRAERLYARAKSLHRTLQSSQRRQKYRDQWERVIRAFVQVADRYPASRRADDALYNAGMITLKLRSRSRAARDTAKALRIFTRLAGDYPESRYADDAQYMIGEIQRTIKKDAAAAYAAYAAVVSRFPRGDMVALARRRLTELPAPAGATLDWIIVR